MNIKFISFLFAILIVTISCNSQNAAQALNPVAFSEKMKTSPDAVVLDVRTPGEFSGGFIAKATNVNFSDADFKSEISKLDKNKTYLVYCLSGKRSGAAAGYMRSIGFKDVINLEGGILAWQSNNLPLTTEVASPSDKISFEAYTQMITSDTAVLVDYFAPWCAPCIKMKPMLEEIDKEYAGKVKVIRLDINENKELAKKLKIVEIPILKIFIKGKETWMHQGYIEKADLIKQF